MMLGLALALPAVRRVNSVDPAAATYIAAMTSAPDATRQGHINTLFRSLRSSGVLSKLSHLYLLAAHDAQAARLNAVAPGTNTLVPFNSPVFTANRGYQGDGATSLLDTGYNLALGGGIFAQDSAHMGVWSRTNLPAAGSIGGDMGTSAARVNRSSTDGRAQVRPNAAASVLFVSNTYPGWTCWSRTGAAVWEGYGSAGDQGGGTDASVALTSAAVEILHNASGYSSNQLAAAHMGSGLTATDAANLYSALNTYLTAVGAA